MASSQIDPITEENKIFPAALVHQTYGQLVWPESPIYEPLMYRIDVIRDGSCFFHAIANAIHVPYKIGKLNGISLDRKIFIRDLRRDLAEKLGSPIDITDPSSPIYYDIISRGKLRDFSDENGVNHYSLENMKRELDSSSAVDFIYNEFISDMLNIDIYILDLSKEDVYMIGDEFDLLYKERNSIVLLYSPGHYDLVALNKGGNMATLFSPTNPFIVKIKNRMMELIRLGSN